MVMPMTEVSQDGVGTMTGLDEVVVFAGDAFGSGAVQRTPMLDPLTTVPAVGDTVTLTLAFARAGAVDVVVPAVEPIGVAVDDGAG
jgi:copper(I)-binding protein